MKRHRFRLASVLRVRTLQEDAARAQLSLELQQLEALSSRRRATERKLGNLPAAGAEAVDPDVFHAQRASAAAAASAVRLAWLAENTAQVRVDDARNNLTTAAQQVSVLERLEARERAAHAERVTAAEAKESDDLTSARHPRMQP